MPRVKVPRPQRVSILGQRNDLAFPSDRAKHAPEVSATDLGDLRGRESLAQKLVHNNGEKAARHSRPRSIQARSRSWREQVVIGADAYVINANRVGNHLDILDELGRGVGPLRPYAQDAARVCHGLCVRP